MPENRWGFDTSAWESAKGEAKQLLADYARRGQMISYSDFVRRIRAIQLEPHDVRLHRFLGEISSEESAAGRGMLTALVVHKAGDHRPGPGFFEAAQQLGYKVGNIEEFWAKQVERVFEAWAT